MSHQFLYDTQIATAVIAAFSSVILAVMFWNSSSVNSSRFTKAFLKLLSLCAVLHAIEVCCSVYRSSRIESLDVPGDAVAVAMIGRVLEIVGSLILIWFLLRPETKKALNGASAVHPT